MTVDGDSLLSLPATRAIRLRALDLLEAAAHARDGSAAASVEALADWLAVHPHAISGLRATKARRLAERASRKNLAARDAALASASLLALEGASATSRRLARTLARARSSAEYKRDRHLRRFLSRAAELERSLSHVEVALREDAREPTLGAVLGGLVRVHVASLAADLAHASPDDASVLETARGHAGRLGTILAACGNSDAYDSVRGYVTSLENALAEATAHARLASALHEGGAAEAEARVVATLDAATRTTASLETELERVARRLEADANVEIEYKYLLTGVPPVARSGHAETLVQGYVPGTKLHERVRRVTSDDGTTYYRTIKFGKGARRVEIEEETTATIFEGLFALTSGKRVAKVRYSVEDSGFTWVVDEFTDRELVLAEVEVPSLAVKPTLPAWLAPYVVRDVTDESTYVNLNLAR